MQPMPRIALLATLACAASAASFAGSSSTKAAKATPPAKPDAATLASHLAAVYAAEAPYDLNVNGALETSEQEQLAAAITDGSVTLPVPPNAPADAPQPPVDAILPHLVELYAAVAPYDVNVDGAIASDELTALQTAITDGTLKLTPPGGKGPGGPGKDKAKGKPKKGSTGSSSSTTSS